MTPKPIVVIKADLEYIEPMIGHKSSLLSELTHFFSEKMFDYHVFVIPQDDREEPHGIFEFQVFYEKDQLPINYEELKQLLIESVTSNHQS